MTDTELLHLIPFFEKLSKMENVYPVICNIKHIVNTASMIHNIQNLNSNNVL